MHLPSPNNIAVLPSYLYILVIFLNCVFDMETDMIRKFGSVLKCLALLLLVLLAICIVVLFIVRSIKNNKYKLDTNNGVEESFYIELGGIEQFVQIRSEDVSNPVVIFLHGGPAFPISYLSYYYQQDLISDYTFVSWDQRGCGRTYYKNNGDQTDLDTKQLLDDLDELVNYSKDRFNKEKIIIIGQSWGSIIGTLYTTSHPENVSVYIGVGQAVDFDYGKVFAAEEAMKKAEKLGNNKDAEILKEAIKIFAISNSANETDIENLDTITKTVNKYLPAEKQISLAYQAYIGLSSPDMNYNDLRWFICAINTKKMFNLVEPLIDYSYYEFDTSNFNSSFDVPMYFIQGEDDWITPTPMVEEYFKTVNSPDKELIIMQGCGHTPFLDDPIEFAESVKTLLHSIEN